jgi:hypothetical protein
MDAFLDLEWPEPEFWSALEEASAMDICSSNPFLDDAFPQVNDDEELKEQQLLEGLVNFLSDATTTTSASPSYSPTSACSSSPTTEIPAEEENLQDKENVTPLTALSANRDEIVVGWTKFRLSPMKVDHEYQLTDQTVWKPNADEIYRALQLRSTAAYQMFCNEFAQITYVALAKFLPRLPNVFPVMVSTNKYVFEGVNFIPSHVVLVTKDTFLPVPGAVFRPAAQQARHHRAISRIPSRVVLKLRVSSYSADYRRKIMFRLVFYNADKKEVQFVTDDFEVRARRKRQPMHCGGRTRDL